LYNHQDAWVQEPEDKDSLIVISMRFGQTLMALKRYNEAIEILNKSMDQLDQMEMDSINKTIQKLAIMCELVNFYRLQKKYDQAEAFCMQVMELGRSKCGESHVSTCQVTFSFSVVYLAQGSYDLA
jgi:tetratricopeptide (TPR) repeat protein